MGEQFKERQYTILLIFGIAALILAGRAFHLQILSNDYRSKAEAVAVSKYTIYPARGLIYDRKENLLINNAPVYDLMVIYSQLKPGMDTTKFCNLLGITKESFKERLKKDFKRDKRFSKIKPFIFLSKISPEVYASFQEHLYQFPGFFVQIRNIRSYPTSHAAHLLGYITEVTEKQIAASKGDYVLGDYIGASGLESSYEKELRGVKGARFVLKDNLGRDVGSFKEGKQDTLPVSGFDIISSIDIELQTYCEQLMQNKIGAVVAIEPASGEILAFVSSPGYDPNLMVIDQSRGEKYMALQKNKYKPLFNRAVMAEYPPGSTFKTLVGLVGMQEGVMTPDTYYPCGGYYVNGGRDVRKCHGHPANNGIQIALQYSCNSYFFRAFRDIVDHQGYRHPERGLDTFADYMYAFGLGKPLGVDFPGEKNGNVPTSTYYNSVYKKGGWKSPTIISVGIGQGEVQLTSLQMANVAAIIANKGWFYTPHFVKAFKHEGEELEKPEKFRQKRITPVKPYYFESVQQGMEKVVCCGTATPAAMPGIAVAGKTGTVQNPHGEDHSTFYGFAPVASPKIAVAVYVENSGWGYKYAAPIAGLIIEKYLRGEISEQKKWRETAMLEANLLEVKPKPVFAASRQDPIVPPAQDSSATISQ